MRTTTALLVKFLMAFVFAYIALTVIDANPVSWVLFIAIVATAVNYLFGDLVVLRNYGNIVASVGDGLMAAVVAYIFALFIPLIVVSALSLIVFAVLVAVGEYFFHRYLLSSDKVAP